MANSNDKMTNFLTDWIVSKNQIQLPSAEQIEFNIEHIEDIERLSKDMSIIDSDFLSLQDIKTSDNTIFIDFNKQDLSQNVILPELEKYIKTYIETQEKSPYNPYEEDRFKIYSQDLSDTDKIKYANFPIFNSDKDFESSTITEYLDYYIGDIKKAREKAEEVVQDVGKQAMLKRISETYNFPDFLKAFEKKAIMKEDGTKESGKEAASRYADNYIKGVPKKEASVINNFKIMKSNDTEEIINNFFTTDIHTDTGNTGTGIISNSLRMLKDLNDQLKWDTAKAQSAYLFAESMLNTSSFTSLLNNIDKLKQMFPTFANLQGAIEVFLVNFPLAFKSWIINGKKFGESVSDALADGNGFSNFSASQAMNYFSNIIDSCIPMFSIPKYNTSKESWSMGNLEYRDPIVRISESEIQDNSLFARLGILKKSLTEPPKTENVSVGNSNLKIAKAGQEANSSKDVDFNNPFVKKLLNTNPDLFPNQFDTFIEIIPKNYTYENTLQYKEDIHDFFVFLNNLQGKDTDKGIHTYFDEETNKGNNRPLLQSPLVLSSRIESIELPTKNVLNEITDFKYIGTGLVKSGNERSRDTKSRLTIRGDSNLFLIDAFDKLSESNHTIKYIDTKGNSIKYFQLPDNIRLFDISKFFPTRNYYINIYVKKVIFTKKAYFNNVDSSSLKDFALYFLKNCNAIYKTLAIYRCQEKFEKECGAVFESNLPPQYITTAQGPTVSAPATPQNVIFTLPLKNANLRHFGNEDINFSLKTGGSEIFGLVEKDKTDLYSNVAEARNSSPYSKNDKGEIEILSEKPTLNLQSFISSVENDYKKYQGDKESLEKIISDIEKEDFDINLIDPSKIFLYVDDFKSYISFEQKLYEEELTKAYEERQMESRDADSYIHDSRQIDHKNSIKNMAENSVKNNSYALFEMRKVKINSLKNRYKEVYALFKAEYDAKQSFEIHDYSGGTYNQSLYTTDLFTFEDCKFTGSSSSIDFDTTTAGTQSFSYEFIFKRFIMDKIKGKIKSMD